MSVSVEQKHNNSGLMDDKWKEAITFFSLSVSELGSEMIKVELPPFLWPMVDLEEVNEREEILCRISRDDEEDREAREEEERKLCAEKQSGGSGKRLRGRYK